MINRFTACSIIDIYQPLHRKGRRFTQSHWAWDVPLREIIISPDSKKEFIMTWHTQDEDDDSKVKVSGDYSRDEIRTDLLFADKNSGEHKHISIDLDGNMTEHHDYRWPTPSRGMM